MQFGWLEFSGMLLPVASSWLFPQMSDEIASIRYAQVTTSSDLGLWKAVCRVQVLKYGVLPESITFSGPSAEKIERFLSKPLGWAFKRRCCLNLGGAQLCAFGRREGDSPVWNTHQQEHDCRSLEISFPLHMTFWWVAWVGGLILTAGHSHDKPPAWHP